MLSGLTRCSGVLEFAIQGLCIERAAVMGLGSVILPHFTPGPALCHSLSCYLLPPLAPTTRASMLFWRAGLNSSLHEIGTTPHHITPHRTTPHHTTPHHTTPHHTTPHHTTPHHTTPHHTTPHHTTPHHTTPHHTTPHHTTPHHTTPHHATPHHTTPHHTARSFGTWAPIYSCKGSPRRPATSRPSGRISK